MVGSLNSRPSNTYKLFDAIERTSLVAAIIGVGLSATFQQSLSVASIPLASFAFFSQLNRRRLEELVQQKNSISERDFIRFQQEIKQLQENVNDSVETRLTSLETAREELAPLPALITRLHEKIHPLELASQQYATQTQIDAANSKIATNQKQVDFKIKKLERQINELSQNQSDDLQV